MCQPFAFTRLTIAVQIVDVDVRRHSGIAGTGLSLYACLISHYNININYNQYSHLVISKYVITTSGSL